MFSGKTEELLRRIRRAEIARKKVQLFKPTIDNRYGLVRVASHDGLGREDAIVVCDAEDILRRLDADTEVVAIDEIQFFDEAIADVCDQLADAGCASSPPGWTRIFAASRLAPCRCCWRAPNGWTNCTPSV